MRTTSIACCVVLCPALVACDWTDPRHGPPDASTFPDGFVRPDAFIPPPDGQIADASPDAPPVTATTIHLTSGVAPLLVVFRDGLTAPWQPATIRTATRFDAVVHGPYIITVVCSLPFFDAGFDDLSTTQLAGTPSDPHDLSACEVPTSAHQVTGTMLQPGFVQLGDAGARSTAPNWSFQLTEPSGIFDLVATTTDAIATRRTQVINADVAIQPAIDMTVEGKPLGAISFTAPNADPAETTQVSVGLLTAHNPNIPARIFLGALSPAKAAPDTALIATDVQSASVRGIDGPALRALRRPIRIGGNTAYTLPPPLGGVQYTVVNGQISVSWTSLPDLDFLQLFIGGNAAGGLTPVDYGLDMSASFVAALGTRHIAIDTAIEGFRPDWTVDFTQPYSRDLTAQKGTELGTLTTSELTELVNQAPLTGAALDPERRVNPLALPRRARP